MTTQAIAIHTYSGFQMKTRRGGGGVASRKGSTLHSVDKTRSQVKTTIVGKTALW